MKLFKQVVDGYRYAFESEFDLDLVAYCRWVKTQVGYKNFYWDHPNKVWRFNDLHVLDLIRGRFPETDINPSLDDDLKLYALKKEESRILEKKNEELKTAIDSTISIPGLKNKGSDLYPYQRVGIEFLINSNGKGIIADGMGLGKTLQAIGYIVHEKIEKTLVICPSSVKYAWAGELKKWSKLKPYIFSSQTKISDKNELFNALKENDVLIINYDLLKRYEPFLTRLRWGLVVVDEFQYIKNNTAQRTKLVKAIARGVDRVVLLSGTPMLNRPVELFNGLSIVDPIAWHDWLGFTKRYCQGHRGYWGWDANGASNIEELRDRIKKYFIRREKENVLKELPPKTFIDIPVELNEDKRWEYNLVRDSFKQYLQDIKKKSRDEINKTLQAEKLVKLGELRQITTNGKISTAKELLENILDSGEKVVVFSVYNEPLLELYNHFEENAVILTGETSDWERNNRIADFQNNPTKKIFFGGIKSAGVGITLTAASNVVFLDYSWVPADHLQAVDRIHRIGQTAEHINVYQLFANNTIDEYMKNILSGKQELVDRIFGDKMPEKADENLVKSLFAEFEKNDLGAQ